MFMINRSSQNNYLPMKKTILLLIVEFELVNYEIYTYNCTYFHKVLLMKKNNTICSMLSSLSLNGSTTRYLRFWNNLIEES